MDIEYNMSKKPGMFVAGEKLTTEFSQGARGFIVDGKPS